MFRRSLLCVLSATLACASVCYGSPLSTGKGRMLIEIAPYLSVKRISNNAPTIPKSECPEPARAASVRENLSASNTSGVQLVRKVVVMELQM